MVSDRAYLKGARMGGPLVRLESEVARVLAVLGQTGAARVEPEVLQPADMLLDLYGEDIRARAFVTRDEGAEMMLRPDFTVPVARLHMDGGGDPARYVYCGPVWRRQEWGSKRPREYLQAGFEVFGEGDPAERDAEVLALVLSALEDAPVELVTGDLGLILAAIDALETGAARKAALRRHVWRPARFHALLERYGVAHGAVQRARAGLIAAEREGRVPALVAASASVGLRDPEEVVARIRRLAEEAATPPLTADEVAWIEAVLAVTGTATEALARSARTGARAGRIRSRGRAVRSAAGGLCGAGDRAGAVAVRGELRADDAGILRRVRVRGAAARAGRPAARGEWRAVRRADPGARPRAGRAGGRRHDPARGAGGADMRLKLGVPSKGRLQEDAIAWFGARAITVARSGGGREYRGTVEGIEGMELVLLAAGEIPRELAAGRLHLGVTGQDLVREEIPRWEERLAELAPMGFGFADLVVAVPAFWVDVLDMTDLDAAAADFRARHGQRLRVATKYHHLVREFFQGHGVADYQLVDSQGATEGTVKNLAAEVVADITTSGSTLRDNHLRVLEDGLILRSQAALFAARETAWDEGAKAALAGLCARLGVTGPVL